MSKWPLAELRSVCREITVGYVSKMSDQYVESGVPFLRSQDVGPGLIRTSNLKFVSEAFHERLKKSRLNPGDVVIVRTGYPGTAAVVPDTLPTANCADLVIARPGPQLDPRYLAFTLNSPWGKGQIRGRLVGVAQQHFNVRVAQALKLPVPPLEMQSRIASILGAYDDLIEVNRRRITVLEGIARRLFEEWFVYFRFPGHENWPKAGTNSASLPEGWSAQPLSKIVSLVRGRSYRSTELVETGGLPFVNLKCFVRDGGFKESGIKRYSGSYKPDQLLAEGDIVMAVTDMTQERRIVGQAARIPRLDEPSATFSMDLVKVVPISGFSNAFLYAWLRFSNFSQKAAQRANGANVLHLSPSALADFPMVVSDARLQAAFERHVDPLLKQCDLLQSMEKRLGASRDLLVPRLINGDVSVASAERQLEAVA